MYFSSVAHMTLKSECDMDFSANGQYLHENVCSLALLLVHNFLQCNWIIYINPQHSENTLFAAGKINVILHVVICTPYHNMTKRFGD